MTSLRRTALIWLTLLLALVGGTAVVIAYLYAQSEAADFLDGQLRQIAYNVGQAPENEAAPPTPHDPEDEFVIAIWSAAGELVRRPAVPIELPANHRPGFSTVKVGHKGWRVYTAVAKDRTVQVAQRIAVREEIASHAAIDAAAPILLVIPLSWLLIGSILGRVLNRLAGVASEIAARSTDSKVPIAVDGIPQEVRPLVEAMNTLITRLQQALDQQKRFVSDAAHELRTPLAALSLQVENLQRNGPTDPNEDFADDLRSGIRRISALMNQLLSMARFDGAPAPRRERIRLDELLTHCVADHVPLAESKGVDLGMAKTSALEIEGVPGELKTLFSNLIDNAVRYSPSGSAVDVSLEAQPGVARVVVVDEGCGVAEADLPRLFDRFFRGGQDVEGSGLGLAIVDTIAKRHGLEVSLCNRQDRRGFVATVVVPGASGSLIYP